MQKIKKNIQKLLYQSLTLSLLLFNNVNSSTRQQSAPVVLKNVRNYSTKGIIPTAQSSNQQFSSTQENAKKDTTELSTAQELSRYNNTFTTTGLTLPTDNDNDTLITSTDNIKTSSDKNTNTISKKNNNDTSDEYVASLKNIKSKRRIRSKDDSNIKTINRKAKPKHDIVEEKYNLNAAHKEYIHKNPTTTHTNKTTTNETISNSRKKTSRRKNISKDDAEIGLKSHTELTEGTDILPPINLDRSRFTEKSYNPNDTEDDVDYDKIAAQKKLAEEKNKKDFEEYEKEVKKITEEYELHKKQEHNEEPAITPNEFIKLILKDTGTSKEEKIYFTEQFIDMHKNNISSKTALSMLNKNDYVLYENQTVETVNSAELFNNASLNVLLTTTLNDDATAHELNQTFYENIAQKEKTFYEDKMKNTEIPHHNNNDMIDDSTLAAILTNSQINEKGKHIFKENIIPELKKYKLIEESHEETKHHEEVDSFNNHHENFDRLFEK